MTRVLSGVVLGVVALGLIWFLSSIALLAVANGLMTRSEILGDVEISISRIDIGYRRAQALLAGSKAESQA